MNKLSKEIIIIIVGSIVLAFGFNAFRAKPLPLIYKQEKPIAFSEEELFGQTESQVQTPDSIFKTNSAIVKDSSKNDKQNLVAQNLEQSKVEQTQSNQEQNNPNNLLKTVTYKQMLQIINNDNFFIIDARSAENYNKSHIGNAINIFPYDEESIVVQKIFELPQNKKLVIYCDGGQCDSSHELAKMIMNFGLKNVYLYAGGWEEWTKQNGN